MWNSKDDHGKIREDHRNIYEKCIYGKWIGHIWGDTGKYRKTTGTLFVNGGFKLGNVSILGGIESIAKGNVKYTKLNMQNNRLLIETIESTYI